MDEIGFHFQVDKIFLEIEDRLEKLSDDIDVDSSEGVLTFAFDDGSNVIISRQVATFEIWVAAKTGGFRLRFDGDIWLCDKTGEKLPALLDRIFSECGASRPFS